MMCLRHRDPAFCKGGPKKKWTSDHFVREVPKNPNKPKAGGHQVCEGPKKPKKPKKLERIPLPHPGGAPRSSFRGGGRGGGRGAEFFVKCKGGPKKWCVSDTGTQHFAREVPKKCGLQTPGPPFCKGGPKKLKKNPKHEAPKCVKAQKNPKNPRN